MNCISFPNIFKPSSTLVKQDKEASKECLYLLLNSEKGTLTIDPYFGIRLKRYTFDQNNYILRDIIIDEIITEMKVFCPQLNIERKDITIEQVDRARLVAHIKVTNKADFTTNMYDLVLLDSGNE